jgi:hypothetical protein
MWTNALPIHALMAARVKTISINIYVIVLKDIRDRDVKKKRMNARPIHVIIMENVLIYTPNINAFVLKVCIHLHLSSF